MDVGRACAKAILLSAKQQWIEGGRLVSLGEGAVSVVGRCGVSVVGRGSVSVVASMSRCTVSAGMGRDTWHMGYVGGTADQQVSAALDMWGLGGVSVDNRSRVVSVSTMVRSRSMAIAGGSCVVSLGGCFVLGRGWVVSHGTNDDDGQDDCGNDGVHDEVFCWWWWW
uniref:Uncharacterized protein n=1 Tax=Anopheles culicifacies TaxID=139723 RepID=A0A182MMR0_9DIPT